MPEANLPEQFQDKIDSIDRVKAWLNTLTTHPSYKTFFVKPQITLLITACDFVISNLRELKTKLPS